MISRFKAHNALPNVAGDGASAGEGRVERRRPFARRRALSLAAAWIALAGLAACSSIRRSERGNQPPGSPAQPPGGEVYGPAPPPGASTPDEAHGPSAAPDHGGAQGSSDLYGPAPVELRPVALVFGPGMARGYAHVGVLRSFARRKIPIGSIYAMGMGSLIGAVYAMDPDINHFEWIMLKFKDGLFTGGGGMIRKFFSEDGGSRLDSALTRVFGARDISDAKIPLHIAIQRKGASFPTVISKGPIVPVLRAALAAPGVFRPASWDGYPSQAVLSASGAAYLCDDAKAHGGNPVVLVDTAAPHDVIRSADIVIRPDLSGIGDQDYSRKTEAAFKGKRATEGEMREVRKWVGLAADQGGSTAIQE